MKQPEALRLAESLDVDATNGDMGRKPNPKCHKRQSAAELRRLYEANQLMLDALKEAEPMLAAMLKQITDHLPEYKKMPALDSVRAAIAKGE